MNKYVSERLSKFISDAEIVLSQYHHQGNVDRHDVWITEVRNFFSVNAPEFNKKLDAIAEKFKEKLIDDPYGRTAYNFIQQQLEILKLARSLLSQGDTEDNMQIPSVPTSKHKKAFVSYSWDDDAHKEWVARLAASLRRDGVEVVLDQWHAIPGDQLPEFIEREIRENDYVLIICTPNYRQKSNDRKGGVGYEGDIMTGEIYSTGNHRKFIPILARGSWADAAPAWLRGKYYINLGADHLFGRGYNDLLNTILGVSPTAPPIGKKPELSSINDSITNSNQSESDEPIRILGVIADEVSEPALDGTTGSALYRVPFRLSYVPSSLWQQLFLNAWDSPPSFTSMHRPGIASVSGDKIVLDGTTIEEVAQYHRDTLVLCVTVANQEEKKVIVKQQQKEKQKRQKALDHRTKIEEISKQIKFD